MIQKLSEVPGIELGVAMKCPIRIRLKKRIGSVDYYFLPQKQKSDISRSDCLFVLNDFKPELLHIEGTETAQAHRFICCWKGKNIVSLQGILNGIEPHQHGNLPIRKMFFSFHPVKTIVATTLMIHKQLHFKPRLAIEKETLQKAENIMGRTTWDRAHAYGINPNAPYFSCNRVLRDPFYRDSWNISKIERHSLFIGNAHSPLKGVHFAFQAIARLKREYPNIKCYIAGENPNPSSWKQWKKQIGYSAYLRHLIKVLDISENIEFLGLLTAETLAKRLRLSHVALLCSTIENSPNTLGESMILGVPSVVAFVGGIPDMASDNQEVLFYSNNDPCLLAYQIKRIFNDDSLAQSLSENSRHRALKTHDPDLNLHKLLHAYRSITQKARADMPR